MVGIRIPRSPLILALVERFGRPLATTSLPADEEQLTMGYQIADKFGHALDILLDLGEELPGIESTVIDYSEDQPILVRKGAGDPGIFGSIESL